MIVCVHAGQLVLRRQLAVEQQVGGFEIGALLRELLDRIAAVFEDAFVAVDEGDGAAAGGGVHEGRVVGHQAEVVVVDFDLAQIGGADGLVGDGDFVRSCPYGCR